MSAVEHVGTPGQEQNTQLHAEDLGCAGWEPFVEVQYPRNKLDVLEELSRAMGLSTAQLQAHQPSDQPGFYLPWVVAALSRASSLLPQPWHAQILWPGQGTRAAVTQGAPLPASGGPLCPLRGAGSYGVPTSGPNMHQHSSQESRRASLHPPALPHPPALVPAGRQPFLCPQRAAQAFSFLQRRQWP